MVCEFVEEFVIVGDEVVGVVVIVLVVCVFGEGLLVVEFEVEVMKELLVV